MIHVPVVLLIGALQLAPTTVEPGITLAATSPDAPVRPSSELISVNRALRYTTFGSLVVTGVLGTLTAINKGTVFTDGSCLSGENVVFGVDYGCNALNIVHGGSAVVSTLLYTATATTGWMLGNIDTAERTNVSTARRVVGWIHLVGIILQPLLGIITAYPQVVGVPPINRPQFSKDLRTIHIGVGYVTVLAYGTAIVMDW